MEGIVMEAIAKQEEMSVERGRERISHSKKKDKAKF